MNEYSSVIHKTRYARYLDEHKRRETWEETVQRYVDNVIGDKADDLKDDLKNAILNMEEIGYVSVIASPEILEWADNAEDNEQTADLSYFFGPEATAIHANQVLYPDKSVIDRCALMHDCDTKTGAMLDMWNRVKGDNLGGSNLMMIVGIVIVLLILFFVILGINKNKQKKLRNRRH